MIESALASPWGLSFQLLAILGQGTWQFVRRSRVVRNSVVSVLATEFQDAVQAKRHVVSQGHEAAVRSATTALQLEPKCVKDRRRHAVSAAPHVRHTNMTSHGQLAAYEIERLA